MKYLFTILIFMSVNVHAWVQSGNTTMNELVQWEASDGSGYALIKLSNNINCYVPLIEKELYSLMLSLFMSGKTFNVHCHDESTSIGGYTAHKLHRVNAFK